MLSHVQCCPHCKDICRSAGSTGDHRHWTGLSLTWSAWWRLWATLDTTAHRPAPAGHLPLYGNRLTISMSYPNNAALALPASSEDASMSYIFHFEGRSMVQGGAAGDLTAAKSRGASNIGRLAIEGLGTAAWHLGVPAPEQSRLLLLASTRIQALLKAAQCSAMITIPAGAAPSS